MITVERIIGYIKGKLDSCDLDEGLDCIKKSVYKDLLNYINRNKEL